jgi:hypothetical protein
MIFDLGNMKKSHGTNQVSIVNVPTLDIHLLNKACCRKAHSGTLRFTVLQFL